MPLLIDAYNLLHAPMPESLAGLDVARLCRLLGSGPWRADRIHVVCDGQPGPLGLLESPDDAVQLHYSGPTRTADSLIIQAIDRDSAPRRLIVVSDDHEIRRAARRRRATVWSNGRMIEELAATLSASTAGEPMPEAKTGRQTLDDEQVRRWREQFGLDGDPPLDEPRPWWKP